MSSQTRKVPDGLQVESLDLMDRVLDRETHVLTREPSLLPSHAYNTIYRDRGDADLGLLERAKGALAGRSWLRLTNRPLRATNEAARVLEHGSPVSAIAWSHDMRFLASGGEDGVIRLWDGGDGRLVHELRWAAASVTDLAWSPQGHLASGHGHRGVVRVWPAGIGNPEVIRPRTSHEQARGVRQKVFLSWSVTCTLAAAYGGNIRFIVGGPRDWSVDREVRADGQVTAVAFAPGGQTLAFSNGSSLFLADDSSLSSHQIVSRIQGDFFQESRFEGMDTISWFPNGKTVAIGGRNHAICFWDPLSREARRFFVVDHFKESLDSFIRDRQAIKSAAIALSPDGKALAYARGSGAVLVWHMGPGEDDGQDFVTHLPTRLPDAVRYGHRDRVTSLAWSPDGDWLASGGADGTIRLWAREAMDESAVVDPERPPVGAVAWAPSGESLCAAHIATDSNPGEISFKDAVTGDNITSSKPDTDVGLGGGGKLSWSADGSEVALRHEHPEYPQVSFLRLIDVDREVWTTVEYVWCSAWSPRGAILAFDVEGRFLKVRAPGRNRARRLQPRSSVRDVLREVLWEMSVVGVRRLLTGHPGDIEALSWASSGSRLACGCNDGSVWIWDPRRGRSRLICRFKNEEGPTRSLTWSPDGRWLAAGTRGGVRLWNVAERRSVTLLPGDALRSEFAPTGRRLVTVERWGIQLWSLNERGIPTEPPIALTGAIEDLAWSSDGSFLATGDKTGVVRVWGPADGICIAAFYCLSGVAALDFDDDGRVLVGDDGTGTGNESIPYILSLSVPDPPSTSER